MTRIGSMATNPNAHRLSPSIGVGSPPQEGYQQFGLLGLPPQIRLQDEGSITEETLRSARWVFALEWPEKQPAWEAFLSSEDRLDPLVISLSPQYVLPALFVARMADQPRETIFDTVKAWTQLLDEISDPLYYLIAALYLHWLDGPSQAAQALRTKSAEDEEEETRDEETRMIFQDALHAFEHIFGTARLDALQHADCCREDDPRTRVEPLVSVEAVGSAASWQDRWPNLKKSWAQLISCQGATHIGSPVLLPSYGRAPGP